MRLRRATVAGRFYPGDAAALAELVDGLLADAGPVRQAAGPVAAIAPHAGYQYSGAVAAAVYAHLAPRRDDITRVVLLGPSHFVRLDGMAVARADVFATPLGPVQVDDDARAAAATLPGVTVDDHPHQGEHSLETQLPFLQRALDAGTTVLPVLVGRTPPAAVAELLSLLLRPGTVAVVSTDLSHYLDQRTAHDRDASTAEAVLARDGSALRPSSACGFWPLRGLLHHAAERGMDVELLRLATSADAGADPGRVVGYGAFLLRDPAG